MQNYHILKIVHLGATDKKPARIKLVSELFKQSVILPYDNEPGDTHADITTAVNYLNSIVYLTHTKEGHKQVSGFDIIGKGESKDGMYLITNTFEPIK